MRAKKKGRRVILLTPELDVDLAIRSGSSLVWRPSANGGSISWHSSHRKQSLDQPWQLPRLAADGKVERRGGDALPAIGAKNISSDENIDDPELDWAEDWGGPNLAEE
jgi:hypothetical protein